LSMHFREKVKVVLILSFLVFFLANSFYPKEVWASLMFPIIIGIAILSFPAVRGFNRYLSVMLLGLGFYLLLSSGAQIGDWIMAWTQNAGLISLLLSVPLLGTILHFDNFQEGILQATKKYIKSDFSFYVVTALIINSLGMLLNLASIPLVKELLVKVSPKYSKATFYRALTRGFCTNLMWSPNFVSVAVVLHYLKIPWHEIAPLGIIMALVGNGLGITLEKFNSTKWESGSEQTPPEENTVRTKALWKLIAIGLGLDDPLLLIPFCLFLIGILSIVGVHPIITISTIAVTMPVETIPLTELQLAITLLSGYLMYILLSPFSAMALVVTSVTNENPFRISFNLNWFYAILYGLLTTLVLMLF